MADWPAASERDLLHIPLLQVRQGSASSPPPNDDAFAQSTSPSTTRVTLAYGEATCDTLQEWLRAVLRIMAYTCACSTDEAAEYLAELERIFRASPEDVARRVVPFSFEEWECVWSAAALDPSLDLGERQRFAWRPVADELFESSWREAELMIRLTPLKPRSTRASAARSGGAASRAPHEPRVRNALVSVAASCRPRAAGRQGEEGAKCARSSRARNCMTAPPAPRLRRMPL